MFHFGQFVIFLNRIDVPYGDADRNNATNNDATASKHHRPSTATKLHNSMTEARAWSTCHHSVGKLSAMVSRLCQLSLPSFLGR